MVAKVNVKKVWAGVSQGKVMKTRMEEAGKLHHTRGETGMRALIGEDRGGVLMDTEDKMIEEIGEQVTEEEVVVEEEMIEVVGEMIEEVEETIEGVEETIGVEEEMIEAEEEMIGVEEEMTEAEEEIIGAKEAIKDLISTGKEKIEPSIERKIIRCWTIVK